MVLQRESTVHIPQVCQVFTGRCHWGDQTTAIRLHLQQEQERTPLSQEMEGAHLHILYHLHIGFSLRPWRANPGVLGLCPSWLQGGQSNVPKTYQSLERGPTQTLLDIPGTRGAQEVRAL